jgi:hypothetical protein
MSQAPYSVKNMDESILDTCAPEEIVDSIGQLHGLGNAARRHLSPPMPWSSSPGPTSERTQMPIGRRS